MIIRSVLLDKNFTLIMKGFTRMLMKGLELTLSTTVVTIKIGQSIGELRDVFSKIETSDSYYDDPEINLSFLKYPHHGLEFVFEGKSLISLFIYIKNSNFEPFNGSFGSLNKDFFSDACPKKFYDLTLPDHFVKWFIEYPFAIDMVKNDMRLRYTHNPNRNKTAIYFSDLTILLRKIKAPLNKDELIPQMMDKLKNIEQANAISHLNELDYENNCLLLIDRISSLMVS